MEAGAHMYMHKIASIQVKLMKQQLKRLTQLTLLTRCGPARHSAHELLRRACRMFVVYYDTSLSLALALSLPRSLSLTHSLQLSACLHPSLPFSPPSSLVGLPVPITFSLPPSHRAPLPPPSLFTMIYVHVCKYYIHQKQSFLTRTPVLLL